MEANGRRSIRVVIHRGRLLIMFACGLGALAADGSVFAQARSGQPRGAASPARAQTTKPADAKATAATQASSAPASSPSPPPASSPVDAAAAAEVVKLPDATSGDELALDRLAARIKELEAATDDSQPDRVKLLEVYRQAEADVKSAGEKKSRAAELEKKRIAAPYELQARKQEAAKAPATAVENLPGNKPLSAWQEMLAAAEHELAAAEEQLGERDDVQKRRAARRLEIPPAIATARMKLDETSSEEDAQSDESAELAQARKVAARAARSALQAEVALLEKELQCYDEAADELTTLNAEEAAQKVAALEKRVSTWRDAINDRRQTEADREAAEAHWAAATAEPAVRQLADGNSALAEQHQQVSKAIDKLTDEGEAVSDQLKTLKSQFEQTTEKLKSASITAASAQLLRKSRAELATIEKQRAGVERRQQEIFRVQLELNHLEEETAQLRDPEARAKQLARDLSSDSPVKLDDIRSLVKSKRTYLADLVKDENLYYENLVDVNARQQLLLSLGEKYRAFIDERILWTASATPLSSADFATAAAGGVWLVKPSNWQQAARALADHAKGNPLAMTALLLVVAGLWFSSQRARRAAMSDALERTLAGTMLLAARWPATLACAGWAMSSGSDFSTELGSGLLVTASVLFPLSLLRRVCCASWITQSSTSWPAEEPGRLARQLSWLIGLGVPAVAAFATIQSQPLQAWNDSLGRMLLVGIMATIAGFVVCACHPHYGPLARLIFARRPGLQKLSLPILIALTAIPMGLAVLAAAGYYDTAVQMAGCIEVTVWLALSVAIAHKLAAGWLQRAWLRLSDSRRLQPDLDITAVAAGSYRLLRGVTFLALGTGLAFVWADVFPVLRSLDQITLPLYHGADPAHSTPVTLLDFIEGCAIAAMTFVAARNLPGLVEFLALARLPLDTGLRYALAAVVRYTIAIVGLLAAGGAMGIGWPKLQWLVAAISFGLGFGLQEIFANFVSGLIVLMERPVRIGDTVTVGDTTGVVSRIQMRATTILDADRKELIVPNKDFITSRLVNWTLSDSIIRLVVRIGLPYGTDTDEVQRLLLGVAAETPDALKYPPPKAVLVGFSEKTLDFELRVFVADVESLMPVRHRLNTTIEHALRDAGINFAAAPSPSAASAVNRAPEKARRQQAA
jgi:potassium-dependent mechanosensitive channel